MKVAGFEHPQKVKGLVLIGLLRVIYYQASMFTSSADVSF